MAIAEACLFSTSRLHLWKTLDRGELHRLLNASDVLTPDMLLLSALRYLHEDAFWDLGKNLLQPEVAVLAISVDGCERALTELFDLPLSRSLLPWLRALWAHEPVRRVMEGRVAFDRVKEIQGVFDEVSFRKGEARKAFNDVPSQARETQRVFDATGSRESEMRRVLNESSFRTREVHPVLLKRTSGGRRCWQECAASSTEIQVNNAGLVLLWPLLPDLLCRLGLRGKDRFIDAQAQTNAACWLDTLIWNDDYAREWRMPFTKWLCGLPLECEIEWQAPDETTTEQLHCWLATLPEQLPGWRTLQVQDIRTLFLQRPGEMLLTETSLKLKVQREPFDILLNDWPWPLNQVMLPWLEQPLMIEWL
ncbi:hypothetical protein AYM40_06245 [Paraburkholderia phytofirmans OLGA172]|uniref:Uncharacterized protein n=1 Tax=Paraburkholderia phytofirmans OLGA172 TaxID=1417228 RepID=A0A160FIS5_9BURK|nr:hypothetical protein AYM40_06245 [Paraburkholderia phytofirmans OLGA172]